jgi:transposase
MDNAPIHHSLKYKEFYTFNNVFFNPAYSPMLNPIEEFFSLLKFHIK